MVAADSRSILLHLRPRDRAKVCRSLLFCSSPSLQHTKGAGQKWVPGVIGGLARIPYRSGEVGHLGDVLLPGTVSRNAMDGVAPGTIGPRGRRVVAGRVLPAAASGIGPAPLMTSVFWAANFDTTGLSSPTGRHHLLGAFA